MCKRFHAYYKPLSPIPQDALFPVYSGTRFLFFWQLCTKDGLFSWQKTDHFLKAGVSHCSHAPGTHRQAPAPATASSTINDCLIAGIFLCFFLRFAMSAALWPSCCGRNCCALPFSCRKSGCCPFCGSGHFRTGSALCSGGMYCGRQAFSSAGARLDAIRLLCAAACQITFLHRR